MKDIDTTEQAITELDVMEKILEALEGVVKTLVGMQGIIPQNWLTDDVNNVSDARKAFDAIKAQQ